MSRRVTHFWIADIADIGKTRTLPLINTDETDRKAGQMSNRFWGVAFMINDLALR